MLYLMHAYARDLFFLFFKEKTPLSVGGRRVKEKSGSWKGRLQMCTSTERHTDGVQAI